MVGKLFLESHSDMFTLSTTLFNVFNREHALTGALLFEVIVCRMLDTTPFP